MSIGIEGCIFSDIRGKLTFFNAFDMTPIVRFYEIEPKNSNIIRAWQGHKRERKWFYCPLGSFVINLIKVDDFENPSDSIESQRFELSETTPLVLEIPGGYATGFKSTLEKSKLMVFSDFTTEKSKNDDYRFPLEKWNTKW